MVHLTRIVRVFASVCCVCLRCDPSVVGERGAREKGGQRFEMCLECACAGCARWDAAGGESGEVLRVIELRVCPRAVCARSWRLIFFE